MDVLVSWLNSLMGKPRFVAGLSLSLIYYIGLSKTLLQCDCFGLARGFEVLGLDRFSDRRLFWVKRLVIVFFIVTVIYACDCGFVEAIADFETYGLQWIGRYVDGELLHLVPVWPVFVVVAGALVDEEGDDDVGVDFIAHRDHLRFAVAGHDVRVGTGFAERCRTNRSSALDVWLAHGRPFFLTSAWLDCLRAQLCGCAEACPCRRGRMDSAERQIAWE